MTPQIIFWLRIGVILWLAYIIFSIVMERIRQHYFIPKTRAHWKKLANDLFSVALGIFLLFLINRNFKKPADTIMAYYQKPLPTLSFLNLKNHQTETIQQHQKKAVILNLWATWCGPCRRELPALDKLQKEISSGKLEIIAISDEAPETVLGFLKDHDFSFQAGVLVKENELISKIQTRPVSILVNSNGEVQDVAIGARGFDFFHDWAESMLKD